MLLRESQYGRIVSHRKTFAGFQGSQQNLAQMPRGEDTSGQIFLGCPPPKRCSAHGNWSAPSNHFSSLPGSLYG